MYIKLSLKDIKIEPFNSNKIIKIDCPNKYGGIGEIEVKDVSFYAGSWFNADKLRFQICNLTYIEYSMKDFGDETNWILFWQHPITLKFSYGYWFDVAKQFKNLISMEK
jgi:hypothetical protein